MQAAIFGFGQYSLGPKIEIHSNGILTFELSKGLTKVDIIVKLDRHKSYPMSVCFCLSEGQLSETSNGRSWPLGLVGLQESSVGFLRGCSHLEIWGDSPCPTP